ncbi:fanconi anemia group M protein [Halogranum gelatinilyticum]|uniref:Fanconi anemia group M protein n=1 Tax=Halogranum gelatinilyticum TaxID=660521 RepID=A0A1G9NU52_9EURY|nr:DEAD/DEAH box helicase [Halogranum gelatinilyticum]SDL90112.1 fanconi anemia group M protein [Halogranum gelatinilyticum]
MAATDDVAYVEHPLLAPGFIERRLYQLRLAGAARDEHTLVCLPTGLGKTTVSLLLTAERLHEVGGKSLFLAPTKPLVQQHAEFYREALEIPDDDIVVFTGEVRPDDRAELWESARIVIATPQVVENDLVGNRISLRDVTHLTFDECHRGTGDYAYVYIAERYHADAADPLVTGMSASPGGDEESILEVCENLGLTEVAVMTEDDADVAEHTYDTDVRWEKIQLPDEILEIRDAINEVIVDRLEQLKELGVSGTTSPDLSQKKLNAMRGKLRKMMDNDQSKGYKGMSIHAEVMKLRRAVELVETQSVESVRRYFERQRNAARSSGASKASQRLVSEPKVREAMRKAESFDALHPKFSKTRILLAETLGINDGERVIVFTESRDTAEALTEFLSQSFSTQRFVGQGNKEGSDGMSQKEQQETLNAFRNGEFEVLVSTSVAEEGLDVPEVDLVLFYEPVPTAIRSIQRKGRTGRQTEGKVIVLMAEDTRDEVYFWISRRRESKMENELQKLKTAADELEQQLDKSQKSLGEFSNGDGGGESRQKRMQPGLADFDGRDGESEDDAEAAIETDETATAQATEMAAEAVDDTETASDGETDVADSDVADADADSTDTDADNTTDADSVVATAESDPEEETVEIVVDQRELDSNIARDLSQRDGVHTRLETLAVGDYILSDRVAVERKSVSDFLDTLTGGDRSMFEQVRDMSRHYSRPVVIIEGEDLYGERNVHPNAIRGAIASLAVDYGASVLRTENEGDTADLLEVIASREQTKRQRTVSAHGEKSAKTLSEQQEYVVESIADIGPVTAQSLLEHFGSVEAVMIAPKDDLLEVSGVGKVTADRIREIIGSDYE